MTVGKPAAKLKTLDILVWLSARRDRTFSIETVCRKYGIKRGEAQRRVNYLRHLWSCVRLAGKEKKGDYGRAHFVYELTAWGRKYSKEHGGG